MAVVPGDGDRGRLRGAVARTGRVAKKAESADARVTRAELERIRGDARVAAETHRRSSDPETCELCARVLRNRDRILKELGAHGGEFDLIGEMHF